ncbi:hypothetical protein AYO39_02815 [Actinobacteria bacterium SCGC AG-212-D09]|nr:hypothetical protein AYO39_02815 [Actinobacteria bacterium SCGC AG-212-D09]
MEKAGWDAHQHRVVVPGIKHGNSGYTNHGCRCEICTAASRAQHRAYRARRFGDAPICVEHGCNRLQSRAYGYGLCYKHARDRLQSNSPEVRAIVERAEAIPPDNSATLPASRRKPNRHGYESAYFRYLAGGRASIPSFEGWGLSRVEGAEIRKACDQVADRLLEAGVAIIPL